VTKDNHDRLLASEPDYVIIYLGNNDGKKLTWDGSGEKSFVKNYNALID
jgi:lysophospholipase L1-like esterase